MCKRIVGVICVLAFWGTALPVAGQEVSVPTEELGAFRDTLDLLQPQPYVLRSFILPGTEKIFLDGTRLDTTVYRIDYRFGRLWIDGLVPDPRRMLVAVYRTWGFAFQDDYRHRSLRRAGETEDSTAVLAFVEEELPVEQPVEGSGGTKLQRSGSISRGILVGNNRDATVESGLRLQVSGEVAEGINVQGVLTDENTPILPEGTTQRLDEFDRVFIQIDARQGTAQLGDFDLRFAGSEFARFARKLQGITVFGEVPSEGVPLLAGGNVAVAGATARGIFQTQDLSVLDGVQGPYRLVGKNNERFIIVIPGSEDVFVDGQRLTRGESNDYVIDYATGEITFTSNRLIRQDLRVTVEFQYRTTEFTRTIMAAETDVGLWARDDGTPRARFGVTFLREADGRQFNEEFGLTTEDEDLLAAIGDSTAQRSGATRVDFDSEAPFVQYVQRDTTFADGSTDTFFEALTAAPPDTVAVFQVRFSRVNPGEGRYVREGRTVNGILYRYVGPGRGEYEPVRLLPKPKQQRLFDLRGGIEPLPGLEVFGEWAQSLNDENRFSNIDANDDVGKAYTGGFRLKPLALTISDTDLGTVSAEFRRRFTGNHFATFDRTRPVEFARRWNLDSRTVGRGGETVQVGNETIDEGHIEVAFMSQSRLRAEGGRIRLSDTFRGTRQAFSVRVGEVRFPRITYRLENIRSEDAVQQEDGFWLRQQGRVEQPLLDGRLVPRFEFEHERRKQRVMGTDSLAAPSLAFVEYRPGIAWTSKGVVLGGSVELRTDELWADGGLRDASRAWTIASEFKIRSGTSFNTEGSVGYRVRRFNDFFRVEQKRQNSESVVLRWNGRYMPFQRAVNLNWTYEALTERTPKLQEIYVRTGAELGEFVWEDSNDNGVIEIDEFIPERTQDEGTYVRTFIPSDSLTAIISVQARVSLQLDPSRLWRKADARWKRWLSNITTRTTIQIQEKSRDSDLAQIYLLNLRRFRSPVNTLRGVLRIGQDVLLFRTQPRYGVDVGFNQIRSLSELTAGEETRFVNQWRVEGKVKPSTRWGVRLLSAWEQSRSDSKEFASRRYDIESLSVEPEVAFNPIRSLQLAMSISFAQKRDQVGDRKAQVLKVPLTARFSLVRRLNLSGRIEMANVTLDGEASRGLANFELTDGRGKGRSYLWTVTGWYQLSRLLRASFSYNGRAPADAPTLHTVRVQLSAVF
ncbi:MAG: hypothetical protein ACE5G0_07120 [Rhodothermales bacterium]